MWSPLDQSVELRSWDLEVPGSSLVRVGGFHMHSWSRSCLGLRGAEVENRVSRMYK